MAKGKSKSGKLSVFKGHEARLNSVIFHILALKGPLTIYDIHKEVKAQKPLRRIRYASVNKRVRILKELGYVDTTGTKKTKAGFEATIYELTARAYLAILLNSMNLEEIITKPDETTALALLATMLYMK